MTKDFIYLCHVSVEKWYKFMFLLKKKIACKELTFQSSKYIVHIFGHHDEGGFSIW